MFPADKILFSNQKLMSKKIAYPNLDSVDARDAVVSELEKNLMQYAPLVKRIAYQLIGRLPANIELDDLIQVGLIGLLESARQFDPAQNVLFETYASQRIKGSMLDELRRQDWLPRQARQQAKQIDQAWATLEKRLDRTPLDSEVAEFLGVPLEAYQTMLFECKGHSLVYLEDLMPEGGESNSNPIDFIEDNNERDPFEILGDENFRHHVVDAIKTLTEREQLIMSLYYEQDLNLREIGEVLNVSESRVSQLHTQIVAKLRVKLREWLN